MLIRKGMDLSENERISNITIRHKLKERSSTSIAVLHLTVTVRNSSMGI
jgi:hypothetical protein